ncbi:MAG: tRNA uridine(34) 5-carboxymethylaminomethyl modification radical SAM/GNAT enzyme Elp3 [Candidatus Abawacabacteria bacterium]|nr:tRNA uridine(34) 5-carboxymethylaminomethyl modification radical SAM/GNAT enzyme Elp3 [Candidatus Abawacabacteria bacterium]
MSAIVPQKEYQKMTPALYEAAAFVLQKIISEEVTDRIRIDKWKREAARKFQVPCPAQTIILAVYRDLVEKGKLGRHDWINKTLKKSAIRTLSGVAPIPVLTKPYPCPGKCVYCPTEAGVPKSYNSNEPAVMRAITVNWDSYRQVAKRLYAMSTAGHTVEKVDLIVMGGTFSFLPRSYQASVVRKALKAMNEFVVMRENPKRFTKRFDSSIKVHTSLPAEMLKNESAAIRCIGITFETRPDYVTENEVIHLRKLGGTRIEIGVQSVYDDVNLLTKRGHGNKEAKEATFLLKEAGFKLHYHTMPNLPGSDLKRDQEMYEILWNDSDFRPDQIKIYPCVVTIDAELKDWFDRGEYHTYSDEELINMLTEVKKNVPYWVRIVRLGRDIPQPNILDGSHYTNFRELVQAAMKKKGYICRCIRCREVRDRAHDITQAELFVEEYIASQGKEYFISIESKDRSILYAHLRLRIPYHTLAGKKHFIRELTDSALIREVHTYGEAVPLEERRSGAAQHIGFGRMMMDKVEQILQREKIKKIAVISGVGVRGYYRKLGYELEGTYMVKKI